MGPADDGFSSEPRSILLRAMTPLRDMTYSSQRYDILVSELRWILLRAMTNSSQSLRFLFPDEQNVNNKKVKKKFI